MRELARASRENLDDDITICHPRESERARARSFRVLSFNRHDTSGPGVWKAASLFRRRPSRCKFAILVTVQIFSKRASMTHAVSNAWTETRDRADTVPGLIVDTL